MIANKIINNSVTEILKTPTDGSVTAYAGVGMFLCNNGASNETLNLYAIKSGQYLLLTLTSSVLKSFY